jgi:hypothetical protein
VGAFNKEFHGFKNPNKKGVLEMSFLDKAKQAAEKKYGEVKQEVSRRKFDFESDRAKDKLLAQARAESENKAQMEYEANEREAFQKERASLAYERGRERARTQAQGGSGVMSKLKSLGIGAKMRGENNSGIGGSIRNAGGVGMGASISQGVGMGMNTGAKMSVGIGTTQMQVGTGARQQAAPQRSAPLKAKTKAGKIRELQHRLRMLNASNAASAPTTASGISLGVGGSGISTGTGMRFGAGGGPRFQTGMGGFGGISTGVKGGGINLGLKSKLRIGVR